MGVTVRIKGVSSPMSSSEADAKAFRVDFGIDASNDQERLNQMQLQIENNPYILLAAQFAVLFFGILAVVYGMWERQRRKRVAEMNGGYPTRTGDYSTGLFECISLSRVC